MRGWLAGGTTALLWLAAGDSGAAVTIDHAAVTCIVAEKFPRFEARFAPAADVSRARLHFRPAGGPHWYSVSMKREGELFAGVLPKPKKNLKRMEYYIETTDSAFGSSRTADHDPVVESGPLACKDRVLALMLDSASVLIEGPAGAPLVPVGFDPEGVVAASVGTPVASSASAVGTSSGAAKGGGIGTKGLVIAGAAVATAGVAVAVASGGGSDTSSTTGGGTSPTGAGGEGACTARPVTASLANALPAQRCGQRLAVDVVVTNGSCAAITILSLQLTQNAAAGPFCSAAVTQNSYAPTVSSVAAGQTRTILSFFTNVFCCAGGSCPGVTTCSYDETFVVQTSAGPLPAGSVPLQVGFDPTCAPCPTGL